MAKNINNTSNANAARSVSPPPGFGPRHNNSQATHHVNLGVGHQILVEKTKPLYPPLGFVPRQNNGQAAAHVNPSVGYQLVPKDAIVSSQPLGDDSSTSTIRVIHPNINHNIPQMMNFLVQHQSPAQFKLQETIIEKKKTTYYTSNRVLGMDQYYPADQTPQFAEGSFPLTEVIVTEVAKTTQLVPTTASPPRDLLFEVGPSSRAPTTFEAGARIRSIQNTLAGQRDLLNLNDPVTHGQFMNIQYVSNQDATQDQSASNLMDLHILRDPQEDHYCNQDLFDSNPYLPKNLINHEDASSHKSTVEQGDASSENTKLNEPNPNINVIQRINPGSSSAEVPDNQYVQANISSKNISPLEAKNNGRNHSLPRVKHDPYTCPKCMDVFHTPQKYACHASSHYKTETKVERKKRHAARYKKERPALELVQSSEGLTARPKNYDPMVLRMRGQVMIKSPTKPKTVTFSPKRGPSKPRTIKVKKEEDEKQKMDQASPSQLTNANCWDEGLVDVEVKEEKI